MDIYANLARIRKTESQLVTVGRIVGFSSLLIAMIVSRPLLGNFDQAFQYIQEFTGFFTPGIVAIFLLAIFWRSTTANGALGAAVGSAALSLGFKLLWPDLPFIDRVGVTFLLCVGLGMLISRIENVGELPGAIKFKEVDCSTSAAFNLASVAIVLMLIALYATWW
jgi:SSS family solute:Na+ symporter